MPMRMLLRTLPIAAAVLMSACSSSPKPAEPAKAVVRARGEKARMKVVWGVDAVDVEKRKLSIRGPGGQASFTVGPEVKRLSEMKAGDTIFADYQVSAVIELREPTKEEQKAPLVLMESIDRKPSNLPPGGTLIRTVRVVAAIEALNVTAGTVTIKGPLEGEVVAKVDDASIMPALKVGQKIVVTFDETLSLSVDPGTRK
jgi:hypothetical protein